MKKVRVLFVCLGNICRSPLGAAIMKKKVKEYGLESRVDIDSCGSSATVRVFLDGAGPILRAEAAPDTCGATSGINSAAFYTADWIRSLLFGVQPGDPATWRRPPRGTSPSRPAGWRASRCC